MGGGGRSGEKGVVRTDQMTHHCHEQEDHRTGMVSHASGPSTARILSLWRSCTIKPANRLNVLGILMLGLTSIKTFFSV